MAKLDKKKRCSWPGTDPLMVAYQDCEWGRPSHDDRVHFEFLILEAAQAGLSWSTVLKKREGYRKAFSDFDPIKVSKYTARKIEKLLLDTSIIRNRLKIEAAVNNAKKFLDIQKEFGSFDTSCWRFVGGQPIVNIRKSTKEIPTTTPESDAFSKELRPALEKAAVPVNGATLPREMGIKLKKVSTISSSPSLALILSVKDETQLFAPYH